MSRNPPQTPQRTTLPVQTDMPLPMPMPTTADTTERQFSSRRSSPAPPLSICGNVHSSAHPHPSTPGGRPPSLLFGRASPGPLSVTSTGLSLAAGLPSSPSPYLLRSAEIGDYFDRRGSHQDLSLADSPLALRRANVNANTNANANVASSSTGAQRLSSNGRSGSVSSSSSASSPSPGVAMLPSRGVLNESTSTTGGVDADSRPHSRPHSRAFDLALDTASTTTSPASGAITPVSRRAPSQPGSVLSDYSAYSRSGSVDVDVGVAFPSSSPVRRMTRGRTQPTVIRSTSGRGIMFVPRTADPVSRPASFSGAGTFGIELAHHRASLPMSPSTSNMSMTSRGSASSSLAGVLAAARSAPSPSPVPIPDRLEPLSPVSPALPSPASATASTTVGGTSVPGTDTASTAVPQRGPRRTSSSSSQSSLRARFLARAPPEASVTATLVSTSLSSGAHNIDHSYSHSLTDSMSPLPTHGRRRAAPGRGIVSSSGEVQSPALQTHANANAQASDMNDANAHTNTHGSMHAAGPVPVQLQPSGPGTKDGQIPTHKGPKLGGDKEGPGVGTGEIAVAGNTNLRSFETTVDATSVSLGISTATTTTSTAELTEVKETKAEAETETESDTAVQPDSTPAQALSPPSSSSRKQAGTDSLPSTPQAPASSRYSSSYRPRTMNALHAGQQLTMPADDYAPSHLTRGRGKQASSWHARSDSEGETELHEVDDSAAQTATTDSMTFAGSSSDTAGAHSASLVGTNTSGSGSGSGSEYSPHLDEIDRGGYNPPYAVRKRTPRIVAVVNAAAVMTETEVAEADRPCLLNHASPSTISSASKGKTRLNHLGPDVDDTGLIEDADLIAPAPTLSEPFTVTFAAALASPLPLPFDRRRMELVVAWSSPQGLWQYVPLAQYVPSWGLHFGGTRMRIQDEGDGHGFEVRDLVREFVGCIPVVGRFAAWL